MKQIVVAYTDIDQINNHELMFPSTFVNDLVQNENIQILVHKDPHCAIVGDKALTNYDFVVSSTPQPDLVRNVVIERYSKPVQAARLVEYAEHKFNFPHFRPVRTWNDSIALQNDCSAYHTDKVVIKYIHGARGICQLFVGEVDGVNKYTLMKRFGEAMTSFRKKALDLPSAEEFNNAFREHLKTEFQYKAVWTGLEEMDYQNKGVEYLDPRYYFMQEYCADISAEYRVLVGVDKELHFFRRGIRSDRPFPQATGTRASMYSHEIANVSQTLNSEIREFLLTAIPAMNSADLFLVEKAGHTFYGIFEYCNQFGMDTDDPHIFKNFHTNFILHHARKFRPDLFV